MDKINIKILNPDAVAEAEKMMVFCARLTQRGHSIHDMDSLMELYNKMELKNPACVIDTNHSNSGKKYAEQVRIAKEVMHNRKVNSNIHSLVKGLMIESYIEEGCQKIG